MNYDDMVKLTICSAYYSLESLELLELNYDFVKKLNPDADFKWLVANNAPNIFVATN